MTSMGSESCALEPISPKCEMCLPFGEEGGGGDQGVENEQEPSDEAIKPFRRKAPSTPTRQEFLDHQIAHLPWRNWCSVCVRGNGKSHGHRIQQEDERGLPTIHVDYWTMRDHEGAAKVTVMSLKDDSTKSHAAHAVSKKGHTGSDATDQLTRDIDEVFGHLGNEIIIKSDQEHSMVEVLKEVRKTRQSKTILEHSPVAEHEANGTAERAVQQHEGTTRVMKLAFEERLKCDIPSVHPICTWLVHHAANSLNKFLIGKDGRTAYERSKKKTYKGELLEFGSCVYCLIPGDPQGGSMEPRWAEGVWLGKAGKDDAHIVCYQDGTITKTKDVRFCFEPWNKECLEWVKGTTWNPNPKPEEIEQNPKVIPHDGTPDPP